MPAGDPAVSARKPTPKPRLRARPKQRKFSDPARSYAKRLERYRPGLVRSFQLRMLNSFPHHAE